MHNDIPEVSRSCRIVGNSSSAEVCLEIIVDTKQLKAVDKSKFTDNLREAARSHTTHVQACKAVAYYSFTCSLHQVAITT